MKPRVYTILTLSAMFFTACYYDKADKLYSGVGTACDTAGMTYNNHIKPILDANCVSCHNATAFSGNVKLHTYSDVQVTIPSGKLLNSVKHLSGGSKNMPPGSKLSDCNIQKIEAWIKRGYPLQ